jgi:hypothetical protein
MGMAIDREARLPTAWLPALAQAHHAQVEGRWDGNDYRAVVAGAYRQLSWQLTMDGHLDTDYPATSVLRCETPFRGSLSVGSGDRAPRTTGTELDVVFAVVSAARTWWRGRGRGSSSSGGEASDGPAPGASLELDDPDGVLTPEVLGQLEHWPTSSHTRSNLNRDRSSLRLSYGTLVFTTENMWGEAVTTHQLAVFRQVIDLLEAREAR